jgi:hypothetical protein
MFRWTYSLSLQSSTLKRWNLSVKAFDITSQRIAYIILIGRVTGLALYKTVECTYLSPDFPQREPEFEPRSRHVGFAVDEVALRQVFPSTSVSPYQFSFLRLLHIHHHHHHHRHHHHHHGAGILVTVVDVLSGLSLTPPQKTKKTMDVFRVIIKKGYTLRNHPRSFRVLRMNGT